MQRGRGADARRAGRIHVTLTKDLRQTRSRLARLTTHTLQGKRRRDHKYMTGSKLNTNETSEQIPECLHRFFKRNVPARFSIPGKLPSLH